jgi:hypothetical protein
MLAALAGSTSSAHPAQHSCAWRSVPLPELGDDVGFSDVDVVAKDDVWIVGSRGDPSRSLVLHYDGSDLEVVDSPSPFRLSTTLAALSVVAPDDVWAVGSGVVQVKPNFRYVPFAVHFDGTAWAHRSPRRIHSKFGGSLTALAALSPSDVWAFGSYERGGDRSALAERWNGKRWRTVHVPGGAVAAATMHAPGSVWVASADFQVFRWNGWRWLEASPGPITNASGGLHGISALTDTDVWVVGAYAAGPIAGRFDGRTLRNLPVPYAHFKGNYEAREDSHMTDVIAFARDEVLAVSNFGIEHHDGKRWRKVHPAQSLSALDAVSRDDVWAVGSRYELGIGWRGIVRHYSCS